MLVNWDTVGVATEVVVATEVMVATGVECGASKLVMAMAAAMVMPIVGWK